MHPSTSTSGVLTDRVLVVDDDVNFHRLAEVALGEAGLKCVCVRSSEEATRLMTGSLPKLMLVDGLLPGVRGDEFARRVRQQHPQGKLPIVFVSAFYRDMKSYKLLTQECGVDLVLHKPIVPAVLRGAVERLLKQVAFPAAVGAASDLEEEGEEIELLDDEAAEAAPETESAEMLQLRAEYLATSKERAHELRAALETLSGAGAEDALHMIRVEAHRFRGSGASFGYPEISRLGGAVEDLILANEGSHESGQLRARLTGLVEALSDKVLAVAGSAPIPLERRVSRPQRRVMIVDAPDSRLLAQAKVAAAKGQPIDGFSDLDEALRHAIELRPDAVFVGGVDVKAAIQRLRAGSPAPVVVLANGDRLDAWLDALHAGAVGYVARPREVDALFRLAAVYARPKVTGNVLAVGGDRSSLSGLAEILAPRGVAVQPCATTEEFFASLERAAPAMVILDGDLPGAKGLDLLRVLRADVNYRRVPVMIFSRLGDARERVAAFEAGADDWVARPIPPDELVVRILAQLARGNLVEAPLRTRDPLTGLYDRAYLLEATTRALQLGRREGRQIALIGIDLRLDGLRKEQGRLAADEVLLAVGARLNEVFRTSDVVARVGPSRLVALLHGAGRADAERLLQSELSELRKQSFAGGWQPQPTAGLAVFPEVTGGAEALLASVEQQLAK